MNGHDYQGSLGFELVELGDEDNVPVRVVRETGADDREASITEWVLWSSLVEALNTLQSIADCCEEDRSARDYASRQTEIRGLARRALKDYQ
jgi:hypothetical protein